MINNNKNNEIDITTEKQPRHSAIFPSAQNVLTQQRNAFWEQNAWRVFLRRGAPSP